MKIFQSLNYFPYPFTLFSYFLPFTINDTLIILLETEHKMIIIKSGSDNNCYIGGMDNKISSSTTTTTLVATAAGVFGHLQKPFLYDN
jgi:hypothetical protein